MRDEANARFECCSDVEHVLKVGREFQMEDRMRGAHYDTAKLLCDTIEYLYERVPKPDPDWKAICEKCHDGDIEPDCEYYGEPNGCNSPIYGEHPKANPGNAAAMREALKPWIAFAEWLLENAGKDKLGEAIRENGPIIRQRMEELRAALSAPARNCDVGTLTEQQQRFHDFCEKMQHTDKACCGGCPIAHLRVKGVIGNSCELAWAQMPYEADKKGEEDGN